MRMKNLFILFILCTGSIYAQERIVPLTGNTSLKAIDFKSDKYCENIKKDLAIVELPFIDDFSADRFPGNDGGYPILWTNRTASINTGWGKNPPTVGVVTFDGADEVGYPYDWNQGSGPADTLQSAPINLAGTADGGFGISFYYQPQGNAFHSTYLSDSLMLEFYAPDLNEWFHVWSTSDINDPDRFRFVYIPIVLPKFLKVGFKFRFTNIAHLQGTYDIWNLDYIWVDQNGINSSEVSNDVAFVRREFTFLDGLSAMPRDHFAQNPGAHMRQSIHVLLRNLNDSPRTLEENSIRILYDGVEIASYSNPNNPAIGTAPNDTLSYLHYVNAPPNNIVFDPSYSTTDLEFEVQIIHGVEDFNATSSNDTLSFKQKFFTHYSYDDGHAEASYAAIASNAEVALRYTNYKSDSIFALQIYTMPSYLNHENSAFTIRIWEDSGDGPGAVIGDTPLNVVYGMEGYQQQWIYYFDEPIYVPAGSFYCGYQQTTQPDGITIGLDLNTNYNQENLYFTQNGDLVLSEYPGTVMIHPMFTSNGYENSSGLEKQNIFSVLRIYPNPAKTFFKVDIRNSVGITYSLYSIRGKLLRHNEIPPSKLVDIGDIVNGIYVLDFEDAKGNRAMRKLIVAR